MNAGLILLDRDGVLNRMVIDKEHGTIDSPLHPDQVRLCNGASAALAMFCKAGYHTAIVTSQPAAAKGKTTKENLRNVHKLILSELEKEGGRIHSSHICFHLAKDNCECRKPKTGLLAEAFADNPGCPTENSWMVGDGITDIMAGSAFGLRTAFLGPKKCDACLLFEKAECTPTIWVDSLLEFAKVITNHKAGS